MIDSNATAAAKQLLAEALASLEIGDLDDALASADKAIAFNPDNAENHCVRGHALRRLGRHAEALSGYDRAIELQPNHAAAYVGRGLTLAALNRFNEAAVSYDRSIEIEPNNAHAYKHGGDLCSKLGRLEQGLIFYNNAILLKPDYASAYYMRANALEHLGRYNEARASIDKAFELDPYLRETIARLVHLESTDRLIELDFAVVPAVRWDRAAPHPQLVEIIGAGNFRYAATIDMFMRYSQKLRAIERNTSNATAPYWMNPWLHPMDAISLYGLVASRNPRRYVEIGSGMSTKFVRRAIADNHLRTEIISIDPAPRSGIDAICDQVIRARLETTDLALFDSLTGDDMVFCDDSHRSFQNSDVTVFFLDVLPRLKAGPLIGVHDIFLPYDYPSKWFKRFYNEQYLLACWLLANDRLRIELPVCHAASTPLLRQAFAPVLSDPIFAGTGEINCGFWFTLP